MNEVVTSIPNAPPAPIRLRPVALPGEHGGWSLLLEPILLGLLVAPSTSALFISLAAIFAFLTRHPLKLAIGDRRRGRKTQRTMLAQRFVLLYLTLSVVCFLIALMIAGSLFLIPLLIAAPFVVVQFFYDATGRSRALWPELTGATGIAAVTPAIALATGLNFSIAFSLWAIVIARGVPTIIYLRTRLQRIRGNAAPSSPAIATHFLALICGTVLVGLKTAPLLAGVALLLLFFRAVTGLLSKNQNVQAKTLGITEIVFGVVFVVAVFAGYRFGI